jgi:AsmA protein
MIQKILLGIVLLCAVSLVGFFLLIKVIDFNEYKPRIQKAIKESTGYETVIRGDITLSLSPVGVGISDIEFSNPYYKPESPFAKLGSFDVALDISALLKKEVKVKHLSIDNLLLSLEKSKDGKLNYLLPSTVKEGAKVSTPKNKPDNEAALEHHALFVNVNKVKFNHATITYRDLNEENPLALNNIDLEMNDIRFDPSKHQWQGLSFLAQTHIDKISYGKYIFNNITMSMVMKDAIASSEDLAYTLFDTPVQGSGKFDFSGKQPKISIKHKIEGLKLNTVVKTMFNQDLLEGMADGDLKLSFFLGDAMSFKTTLNGYVHLFGKELTLKGYDVDKMAALVDKHSSKNLNTLLAGSIEGLNGGKTMIKEFNANLDIGYSEVQLSDVAFSTLKNRVALKGKVNIVDETFVDMKAALLNAKGCSVVEQKVSGTFERPKVKMDEATVTTLTNVALSFLTKPHKSANESQDENCTVFYEGVVAHPAP